MSFTTDILNRIITPEMVRMEVAVTAAEAYFSHRVNYATTAKDKVLQDYLNSWFQTHISSNIS